MEFCHGVANIDKNERPQKLFCDNKSTFINYIKNSKWSYVYTAF